MGEIAVAPEVPPQGAKTCYCYFVIKATRPSATYPAPISTIFETADVNRFPHAYTREKFPNFCPGNFPGPKTAQNTVL